MLQMNRTGRASAVIHTLSASVLAMSAVMAHADAIGPLNDWERAEESYELRIDAAKRQLRAPFVAHPDNGDEARYADRINSYSKGLPHDDNGVVDAAAYQALHDALSSGEPADFEAIPMGIGQKKLRNPQAAYSYTLEGQDSHKYTMPAAPSMGSAWNAADSIEVLWQALTRDVPFNQYDSDPLIAQAVADMNRYSDYRGPLAGGQVTPGTLFRGIGPGEDVGPYVSQFMLQDIPYGAQKIQQRYQVPVAGNDHLTDWDEWLHIQRGGNPTGATTVTFDPVTRYIRNGRDLGQYVLKDHINQAYMNASLILNGYGSAARSETNPYSGSATQAIGPLFSRNHAMDFLSRVAMASQNVAWYQKWLVHRRARPEVFFGRVHKHLTDPAISYDINPELLASPALVLTQAANGSYLLPTATPNGSPLHPSYPAGHAVMAGAAVTMLKAFYKGDFEIPNPKVPNADGTALDPYTGPALTIEGELNKLASNISLGRDTAGVHYRSDGDLGLVLGEDLAISVMQDLVDTYNEDFEGFRFNRFDGTPVHIVKANCSGHRHESGHHSRGHHCGH